jgi:hypothetical protein
VKLGRERSGIAFARRTGAIVCCLAAAATLNLALEEAFFRRSHVLWGHRLAEDAEKYEQLAEQEGERPGHDPGNARTWWLRAVRANPRASRVWIALGLDAERRGNFEEAERDLIEAARVDAQYLPAWTLVNFYFRRVNQAEFWTWARRAAGLAYDDLIPLVELCDRMDPGSVVTKTGETPEIEQAYLDLLVRERRWSEAQGVARKIAARQTGSDRARLVAFTTLEVNSGNGAFAREIWKALFPGASLLTNGDFRTEPSGQGFDWRIAAPEAVGSKWRESRMGFWFTGHEPETCALIEQPLWFDSGRYRLRFEYRTSLASAPMGLRWEIESKVFSRSESDPIEGAVAAEREWSFEAPRTGLACLIFFYRREPGAARAEGSVEIRNVRLERSR